jgi:FKBP-type peptidyl-prolyl cis-trans isomerase FklB
MFRWSVLLSLLMTPLAGAQEPQITTDKEKLSYALGTDLGNQLRTQSVDIDPDVFAGALKTALTGGKSLLTQEEIRAAITKLQADMRARQAQKVAELSEKNKKEGEAFLTANKDKEGVVTLPSGLQYKILQPGDGPKPTIDDTVVCNYRGTFLDGTEFDSSARRKEPATFAVKGVVKAWTEALQLMPTGSKWQLFVPAALAYGDRGAGNMIPPNATLVFEIELLSIKPRQ